MDVHASLDAAQTVATAAALLDSWLRASDTRTLMVAGGQSPLPVYAEIAARLPRERAEALRVFVLDEYVGVPLGHPATCTSLLRRTVAEAWGVAGERFFGLSPQPEDALTRVVAHERAIEAAGGIDVIVLGLGANGHLGFNEPGSTRDSGARLVDLDPVSVEANRAWFEGAYAPRVGATVGLRTILSARRLMLLAFGERKAPAVRAMLRGPADAACPASFLQQHPAAHAFVDAPAASRLRAR